MTHSTKNQNETTSPNSFHRGMELELWWCFQTGLMKICWNLQVTAKRMPFPFSQGWVFLTVCFAFKLATMQPCDQIINNSERSITLQGDKLQYLTNSQLSLKVLIYCSLGSCTGFSTSSYLLSLSCKKEVNWTLELDIQKIAFLFLLFPHFPGSSLLESCLL